jgi:FkbM family methyltransferase
MSVVSYAQSGEDLQIAYFVGRKNAATYIDVGCLWPKDHSNSYFFYERGGHGLCIEPNPDFADDFRAERPRDTFLNCGISDRAGELTYYMHGNPVFNTLSAESAAEVARQAEQRDGAQRRGRTLTGTTTVPVMTLDEAVARAGFAERCDGRVDFLSIDVEGLELEVIAGFSFDALRPRLVVTEQVRRGRNRQPPEDQPAAQALRARGYWLAGYTGHDLYFMDER